MIRVGIVGATGYMGGEALRILLDHPGAEIAWMSSLTGKPISDYHPNLFGLDRGLGLRRKGLHPG